MSASITMASLAETADNLRAKIAKAKQDRDEELDRIETEKTKIAQKLAGLEKLADTLVDMEKSTWKDGVFPLKRYATEVVASKAVIPLQLV